MSVTVRFAPSPTGHIHVGNARTALFNWFFARQSSGRFILRLDDTDAGRSEAQFAAAIEDDLTWLGVRPDAIHRQSERLPLYAAAAERLRAAGRLYPCYETAEELERRRRARRRRGLPPVYDRAALALTEAERRALDGEGRRPHWRFLLDIGAAPGERREVAWKDLFRGAQAVDLGSLSDPVLVREDGSYLYTLPSVVDDIDMGISHVIRGDDHLTNTAVQLALFAALGAPPPAFGHHNLLTSAEGEPLSKRTGAFSVAGLRAAGYEPLAVASMAARIGTADAVEPAASLDELVAGFAPAKVSRAPARFDAAELDGVNARLLHRTDHAVVAGRLAALGVGGGAPFWEAVRGNLVRLAEAAPWWHIVDREIDPPEPAAPDRPLLEAARSLLPDDPWDGRTWSVWVGRLKEETGRGGRSLFMPLRRALTGRDTGPELANLLPFIGRTRTLARLDASLRR